jgi:MFS transporter, DHA1 family, tetracycline resistance protein
VVKAMAESRKSIDGVASSAKKPGKAALFLIFLTVFIDLVGFGIVIPVLPSYAQNLHADGFTIGVLMSAYSVMQFLFMPFWGRLSDHVGRRPILLISLTASTIGYLIWGFSASLTMLFVSRLVAGAGNANLACAQAYIADITTPENRAKGMGLIGAAFGLGFVLGPAIGGLALMGGQLPTIFTQLGQNLHLPLGGPLSGLQLVGFLAAALSLTDLILTFFLLPEPEKRSKAGTERFNLSPSFYFDTLRNKELRLSFAIFFISTFAFANMEATLVLLTNREYHFTDFQNEMMFTYIGLLIVFVQGGMIHRLVKKYGEKKLITIGCFMIGLGLLLTPLTVDLKVLAVALALLSFGAGINTPSNQSMLSRLAPGDRMGGVLGIGQSLSTLGRILGPLVGGAAFQYLGVACPYYIGATAMLVAFALSFQLPILPKKV